MKRMMAVYISLILVICLVACSTSMQATETQTPPSNSAHASQSSTPAKPPESVPSTPYLVYSPYVVSVTVRDYLGDDYELYCKMIDSVINYDGCVSGFESEQHFRRLWGVLLSEFYPAQKICANYGTSDKPFVYKDGVVQMGFQLERDAHDLTLKAFADRITADLSRVDADDNDVEIIAKLYNHVSVTMQYGFGSGQMYDSIMNNKGVCGEYAAYLILLLDQAGIECYRAGSFGAGVDHAWVIAKMQGQYYHFDPTSEGYNCDWEWFALGDEIVHNAVVITSPDDLQLHGAWDYATGTWFPPKVCPETFQQDTRNSKTPPWSW